MALTRPLAFAQVPFQYQPSLSTYPGEVSQGYSQMDFDWDSERERGKMTLT